MYISGEPSLITLSPPSLDFMVTI